MTPEQEAELYYRNGVMREKIADYEDALKFYYEAMRLNPQNGQYTVAAARLTAADASKVRQAAELYEKAIAQDPTAREPYLELGLLYTRAGLAVRARRVYENGLQHHPGDTELKSRLAAVAGKK